MKKILSLILCVALLGGYCTAFAQDDTETLDALVKVDENVVVRNADRNLLGFGTGADLNVTKMYGKEQNPSYTVEMEKALEKMYNIPFIRYVINNKPLDLVGKVSDRKATSVSAEYNGKKTSGVYAVSSFGPVEVMKLGYDKNPDCEFVFCINIFTAPEDILNFVSFLSDEANESEYGMLRAANGIEKPVKFIIELGNEKDNYSAWQYNRGVADSYVQYTKEIIDVVKAKYPECRFMACGKTAPWGDMENWRKWNEVIAEGIGADIDFVALHLYYHGNPVTMMKQIESETLEDFERITGRDDIKIVVTEHAKYPNGGDFNGDDMRSLNGVLSGSTFLNSIFNNDMTYGANYHTFASGGGRQWAMIDHDTLELTAIEEMHKMYDEDLGDRVLQATVEGESKYINNEDPNYKFSTVVTAENDTDLSIILTNFSFDYDIDVNFEFNNSYTLVNEKIWTAPKRDSFLEDFTLTDTKKNESGFNFYKLPKHSIVVLKLKGSKKIPKYGETVSATDGDDEPVYTEESTNLKDIDSSFAAGEIAYLFDKGIVTGDENNMFNPRRTVTRAEFAAMLAKMADLKTDYTANVFDDVSRNDWFYPYVTAAYVSGFVNGDGSAFNPNDEINFEQAASIASRVYRLRINGDKAKKVDYAFSNDDVSQWALEELDFAISNGIMNKLFENGNLNTKQFVSREQAALVIYKLCKAMGK